MTFQQIRHRADQLRRIPLLSVLRVTGAQQDQHDKAKWHTPQGVLSVNGMKFINWNHGGGGGGAIDLVIHLHNLGFKAAVEWLDRHFPGPALSHPAQPLSKPNLTLPPPDASKLARVKRYLVVDRAIAPAVIEPLIKSGKLYADHRANAVFLLLGKKNTPVGAELRGTSRYSWHGMAPGSRKDFGYFSISDAQVKEIILCESAIDALSCFAIHPQYRCISTAGARQNPLWLPQLIRQECQVYCGFDSDSTGDAMARSMIALHYTVKRMRPSQHDWNDVLKSQS